MSDSFCFAGLLFLGFMTIVVMKLMPELWSHYNIVGNHVMESDYEIEEIPIK